MSRQRVSILDEKRNENERQIPQPPSLLDQEPPIEQLSTQQAPIEQVSDPEQQASSDASTLEPPYSIFTHRQKVAIVLSVSFMGLISPLSSSIYFPALPLLAEDLNVTATLINVTITTYLILQGIAPSFIGTFSDSYGRRPAYVICCAIYLAANIGLGLQRNYVALLVLRCVQSCGSSATVALGSAVVADLVTRAERGKFVGYAALGITLGPALGPVIGGLLSQYLGWPSIFWFLSILSGVLFLLLFTFLPETCRAVVGNGSVPPSVWNRSLWACFKQLRAGKPPAKEISRDTITGARRRPNPFSALKILSEKEGGITLGIGALLYGGYYAVLASLSTALADRFGFNAVQTGLCYLPIGIGSLCSRWTCGYLLDWNFRRHCTRLGVEISKNRQQNLAVLPIEMIRLQISIPLIYVSCCSIIGYGWAMESKSSLAGIEASLFFMGLFFSGALNGMNTLIVDTHADRPATAVAANNLFRCLVGAGAAAVAIPWINRLGMGWTAVMIAGIWLIFSPCLWLVLFRGAKWRADLEQKKAEKTAEKERRGVGAPTAEQTKS